MRGRKRRDTGNTQVTTDGVEGIESQSEGIVLDNDGYLAGDPEHGDTGTINGIRVEQPTAGTGDAGDGGAAPKRRGRKPGSKNRNIKATQSTYAVDKLEALLFSVHTIGATFLKTPELAIDKDEANKLAEALKGVAEQYGELPVLSPKVMAWVNLAMASGAVYGPRIMAARIMKMQKPKAPAPVLQFAGKPNPASAPPAAAPQNIDVTKMCPSDFDMSPPIARSDAVGSL